MSTATESIRVLHVDDDPHTLDLAATFLEREGAIEVETARSADAGLDCLAEAGTGPGAGFDCIVSDHEMPGMDGLEFLEAVREAYPDLPFVLFTGKGSEEIASEAITAGVTDYLNKGSGTGQYAVLANRIENTVAQYRSERELRRSTEHLETLIRNAPVVLFALDSEGVFTLSEGAGLGGLGVDSGDLVGDSAFEVFAGTSVSADIQRALDGETVDSTVEVENRTYEVWYRPVENGGNTDDRVIGTAVDITERAERERRFDAVFNNTFQFMGLLELDGTFVEVNDTALRFAGERATVVGQPIWELDVWGTADGASERVEHAVERAAEGEFVRAEETVAAGEETTAIDTSITPVTDDDGDVELLVAEARDVTERNERRRELETTRARFRSLTDNTTLGVLTMDEDSTIRYANDAVEDLFGYAPDELVGESMTTLMPDRLKEDHFAAIGRYLDGGERTLDWEWTELPARHRDGHVVPIGVSFGEYIVGEEYHFTGVVRDITERKRREREIERERDRFATLFENIPDPSVTADLESGEAVTRSVNDAFEEVFGYAAETVVGEPLNDHIVPDDRLDEATTIDRGAIGGEYMETEVCRRTADGSHREFLFRSVPIEQGDSREAFGIYTDVTERRDYEEYRQKLYDITADAERTVDETIARVLELGGSYLGMESGFLTHIENDTQRIVRADSSHEAIQPGSECPLSESYCRKTIEMDEPLAVAHAAASGWEGDAAYDRFGLEAYVGAKLIVDDERYGTLCFADRSSREDGFTELERSFVDLAVRSVESTLERHKHRIELERQNDQLHEFAGVISHDLRSPLTVANGFLELAHETGDDEYFTRIDNAHDRMDRIIEDVLTLARQGEHVGETDTVDLEAVAADAWANVATDGGELEADDLGTVEADEGRLKQLFENLYRNAVEHAGTEPTVRVGRWPAGFFVEDDGPGVSEAEREAVFESGYTTAGEDGGSGLGLSIVDTIAMAHGWDIAVDEGPDGGARFEVQVGMTRGGSADLSLAD